MTPVPPSPPAPGKWNTASHLLQYICTVKQRRRKTVLGERLVNQRPQTGLYYLLLNTHPDGEQLPLMWWRIQDPSNTESRKNELFPRTYDALFRLHVTLQRGCYSRVNESVERELFLHTNKLNKTVRSLLSSTLWCQTSGHHQAYEPKFRRG